MITQASHHGSLQLPELLPHLLLLQRSYAAVDNITGNQYQVWLLCIHHFHPAMQFRALVMIAQMQVAHHHDGLRFCRFVFAIGQRYLLAYLIVIMQTAINERHEHDTYDTHRTPQTVLQQCRRHQMAEPSKVERHE